MNDNFKSFYSRNDCINAWRSSMQIILIMVLCIHAVIPSYYGVQGHDSLMCMLFRAGLSFTKPIEHDPLQSLEKMKEWRKKEDPTIV